MNPIKVFIADDHPIFRAGLRSALGKHTAIDVIDEAVEGNEAIKKLIDIDFDVALLDLRMPNVGGLDVMIRVKIKKPHAKFIFVSSMEEDIMAIRVVKMGAHGYINKEADIETIVQAVQKVHTGSRFFSDAVMNMVLEQSAYGHKNFGHESLTQREFEIMRLVGSRNSPMEAGEILGISNKTVSAHIANICRKLELKGQSDLIHYAVKNNIFQE